MEQNVTAIHAEIAEAISDSLSRFGAAGQVEVRADRAVLRGHGSTVEVDLGSLCSDWSALSSEERRQRVFALARKLARARRGPPRASGSVEVASRSWLAWALFALGGAVAAWFVWRPVPEPETVVRKPVALAPTAPVTRNDRAARVCEQTLSRVMRGATVGPTDVEGWVVEVAVVRPFEGRSLALDPALASFIDRRRLIWPGAGALSEVSGKAQVTLVEDVLKSQQTKPFSRLRLTFSDGYVPVYFRPNERVGYHTLAHALTRRLAATRGAVYARCDHGTHHALGSWFQGQDPGEAAATLIYFMGIDAPALHIGKDHVPYGKNGEIDRVQLLAMVAQATKRLTKRRVATLIGDHAGMIAGREEGPTTITFPFRDGNRAARASLALARSVGIGPPPGQL